MSITTSAFKVYDSIISNNRPSAESLAAIGFSPILIYYQASFWPIGGPYDTPNETYTRSTANTAESDPNAAIAPVVLDIEHWEPDIRLVSQSEAQTTVDKLTTIIGWFDNENPGAVNLGWYAWPPIRDYWSPVTGTEPGMSNWRAANDFMQPMFQKTKACFPSLYTFYSDAQADWVTYALANIAEARRVSPGKPVIPFILPQFHPAGDAPFQYIPYDFWMLQLNTIKNSGAEGLVVWGGVIPPTGNQADTWDESRAWWQATKDFLATF